MATLTIRNLSEDLVSRLKKTAALHHRSMEQEVRELLQQRFVTRTEAMRRVREHWKSMPSTSVQEVNKWLKRGRKRGLPNGF